MLHLYLKVGGYGDEWIALCEEIICMDCFTLNLKYVFSEAQNRLVHNILLFRELYL